MVRTDISMDLARLMAVAPTTETVNCGTCQACCKHEMVFLQPDEDPDLYPGIEVQTNPLSGELGHMLPHKPNGDCSYLGETGCMIYEKRPVMCRVFSCIGLYLRVMAQTTRNERRSSGVMKTGVMIAGAKRAKESK